MSDRAATLTILTSVAICATVTPFALRSMSITRCFFVVALTDTGAVLIAIQRVWTKRGDHQELLTAQAMPEGTPLTEVKATVAAGLAPSVTTPADAVPALKVG